MASLDLYKFFGYDNYTTTPTTKPSTTQPLTQAPTTQPPTTKPVTQAPTNKPNLGQQINILGKEMKDTGNILISETNNSINSVTNYISKILTTKVLCYAIFHLIMLICALTLFFRCKNVIKENVLQFISVLIVPYFYIIGNIISNSGICNL